MHPIIEQYIAFSPGSQALAKRAVEVFPGGDTRASAHYGPYPLAMAHAEGCVLTDVDGHEIIDFMNNFTSLIHGHAHPDVVEACSPRSPGVVPTLPPMKARLRWPRWSLLGFLPLSS